MTTTDLTAILNEIVEIASGYPEGYGGRLPVVMDEKMVAKGLADAASDDPKRHGYARNIGDTWASEARGWTSALAPEKFKRLGELRRALGG